MNDIFFVARWHSSRDIAIKIQKKDAVSSAAFLDEAQLLKQLQHPNIIKLLGVSSETTPIYLLLEYMVNGRLSNYLREGKGHELGLSQLLWIAAQVSVVERETDRQNEWMNEFACNNELIERLIDYLYSFVITNVLALPDRLQKAWHS